MNFFAIVCALVTACIYSEAMMWHEKSMSHRTTEIDCQGRGLDLAKEMIKVMCKPRPTLVFLSPSQFDYMFHPNYVSVKRCDGFCPNKSCMSVQKEMINVTVKLMDKYDYEFMQCYHVAVEQHTKCKCLCNVSERDCDVRQRYDENNCECVCKRRDDECEENMIWNEKSCECMCNKQMEICSSGLYWVPAKCGCAKVEMMSSSSDTDYNFFKNIYKSVI